MSVKCCSMQACNSCEVGLSAAGVKFNLVMFGSSHRMMWPEARDVTEARTAEAEAWVQANVNARWGGTEILGALEAVFDVPVSKGERWKNTGFQLPWGFKVLKAWKQRPGCRATSTPAGAAPRSSGR